MTRRGAIRQWVADLRGWRGAGLICLLGALTALGQAPFSFPWLIFLTLPLLIWRLDAMAGPAGLFLIGWLAGVGFFAVSLFWIVEPFLVDLSRHGWMAPFALVLMAGGMALFWGTAAALTAAIPLGRGIAFALALCATEYLRAHLFTGFPWAMLAYGWMDTPISQTLALFGPHGLNLMTLLICAGIAAMRALPMISAIALLGAGILFGAVQLNREMPVRNAPLVVRLVQPNAAQHLKWQPEMIPVFYQRQIAATQAAPRPDLVIWPETAVPFLLHERPDLQADIANAAGGAPVIVGLRRREADMWYNSLAVLGADGAITAQYDKSHLVPFGEYIPFSGHISKLGINALATGSGFASGSGLKVVSAPGVPDFLPLICYEAIFPHDLNRVEARPDWLVQVTNDAWFGSITGPYQHLDQARARAIEHGLPLARAANTGVSGMIDARGRVIAALGLGQGGHVDAVLPSALPLPPYGRFGDGAALALWLVTFGLFLLGPRLVGGIEPGAAA